ncbi:large conductance mechanosensitive channel protein MscL [Microbacterium sp. ZXX196]|uniref:large conductance mechanosensitive channel protein MscL n=1 Tax=Microbacterium sp. ZXX196 TaxID=2609291 RepID=UPI001328EF2A|nr:large conductance mechanosensitive channel protein MscL [Microbacterium sp. ZXX196]
MFQGFKDFIMRGNVVELAVAVVIGAAFTAIVTAFVDYIVNPLLGAFVPTGDLSSWVIEIPGIFATASIGIGGIVQAIINFLAIAAVVYFVLVMPMNKLAERRKKGEPEVVNPPSQEELLTEIRDLLAAQKQS